MYLVSLMPWGTESWLCMSSSIILTHFLLWISNGHKKAQLVHIQEQVLCLGEQNTVHTFAGLETAHFTPKCCIKIVHFIQPRGTQPLLKQQKGTAHPSREGWVRECFLQLQFRKEEYQHWQQNPTSGSKLTVLSSTETAAWISWILPFYISFAENYLQLQQDKSRWWEAAQGCERLFWLLILHHNFCSPWDPASESWPGKILLHM